jgi:hypothetical protein
VASLLGAWLGYYAGRDLGWGWDAFWFFLSGYFGGGVSSMVLSEVAARQQRKWPDPDFVLGACLGGALAAAIYFSATGDVASVLGSMARVVLGAYVGVCLVLVFWCMAHEYD